MATYVLKYERFWRHLFEIQRSTCGISIRIDTVGVVADVTVPGVPKVCVEPFDNRAIRQFLDRCSGVPAVWGPRQSPVQTGIALCAPRQPKHHTNFFNQVSPIILSAEANVLDSWKQDTVLRIFIKLCPNLSKRTKKSQPGSRPSHIGFGGCKCKKQSSIMWCTQICCCCWW